MGVHATFQDFMGYHWFYPWNELIFKMMKIVLNSSNTGEVKPKRVSSSPFSGKIIAVTKKLALQQFLAKSEFWTKGYFTNNVKASELKDTAVKNSKRSLGKTNNSIK